MALDLSLYLTDLTAIEFVALDPGDDRLTAIREAYDRRKWLEAAELAMNLATEGVFDITPMSYALYGAFRETGIGVLDAIFEVTNAAVGKNFKAIGPRDRRETFFTTRLVWLFGTIRDNLEYYQKTAGNEWKVISEKLTSVRVREIVDHAKPLQQTLSDPSWEKVSLSFAALVTFLRDFATMLEKQEASAKAAATNAVTATSTTETGKPTDDDPSDEGGAAADSPDDGNNRRARAEEDKNAAAAPASQSGSKRTVTLRVSPQFVEFLDKLKAFETLVTRGQHLKAAIVAEDIQNTLEHFDPRVHFPDLLSRFSQLMYEHAEDIEESFRLQNSFTWKTSAQFYQVDLDKFVRGKKG